jgi:phage-related protein
VVFKIAEGFGAFQRFAAGTNLVKAALVLLGSAAVVAAAKLIIPFLPAIRIALLAALAIGFIVLALDDLITFLEGGDSVIGEFLSELITFIFDSADRGEAWAQTLVAAFNLVKDVGTFLGESIFELEKAFKRIFPIIAKVVETNMIAIGAAIDAVISTFTNAMSTIRGGIRSIAGTLGIDVSSILPEQTGRATAEAGSRLAGGGGNTVTQTNQVGVTVNNSTGDPQAVGEAVGVAVRRELDRNMRNARSALLQAPA